jgi:hypothetical protein
MDVSSSRKPAVDETKEHVGEVHTPPPTQGHKKALQRVEDLWQNEEFRAELAAIQAMPDWRKRSKQLFKFAEENGLDLFTGAPLMQLLMNETLWPQDSNLDVCRIADEVDEILNDPEHCNFRTQPRPNSDYKLSMMLFPIHLCISPMASKRDVLDYVAKRWGEIRGCLDIYYEGEPTVRKRRKAARDQFIWEHREVPSKKLADMVCDEFPGELVTYADINSIKQKLRERLSRL